MKQISNCWSESSKGGTFSGPRTNPETPGLPFSGTLTTSFDYEVWALLASPRGGS